MHRICSKMKTITRETDEMDEKVEQKSTCCQVEYYILEYRDTLKIIASIFVFKIQSE